MIWYFWKTSKMTQRNRSVLKYKSKQNVFCFIQINQHILKILSNGQLYLSAHTHTNMRIIFPRNAKWNVLLPMAILTHRQNTTSRNCGSVILIVLFVSITNFKCHYQQSKSLHKLAELHLNHYSNHLNNKMVNSRICTYNFAQKIK